MSIKDSAELKQLQGRKVKLEAEVNELKEMSKETQRRYCKANDQLNDLNKRIDALCSKNKDIIVSEHAILRYLERALGLDLDQVKSDILDCINENQVRTLGNGKYPIGDGRKAIVRDMTIVSIT